MEIVRMELIEIVSGKLMEVFSLCSYGCSALEFSRIGWPGKEDVELEVRRGIEEAQGEWRQL